MKYLTAEEVLVLHSEIIDKTGGSHGVRDVGLLSSVIEKPKMQFSGKELYPGVFVKAGVYLEAFANYHVFVDGNKRTAFVSAARFLYINGSEFRGSNNEVERFMLQVVVEKLDIVKISSWLRKHSKGL